MYHRCLTNYDWWVKDAWPMPLTAFQRKLMMWIWRLCTEGWMAEPSTYGKILTSVSESWSARAVGFVVRKCGKINLLVNHSTKRPINRSIKWPTNKWTNHKTLNYYSDLDLGPHVKLCAPGSMIHLVWKVEDTQAINGMRGKNLIVLAYHRAD